MNATDTAKPPAIFLMGPTASGKTELALRLCDRLPCDIISVDSALVYRGMDIGTAKPDADTLARYPHRLVDICDPAEAYSAAQFRRDALAAMAEIHARGRIPLLVGGTMLYFKALRDGLADMPASDPALRAAIESEAQANGWPALHAELAQVDPEAAAAIHPNHSQRIARALEVYRASGRPISQWWAQQASEAPPFRALQFAIAPRERAVLHRRIEQRLQQMFDGGFIDEVRELYARGDLNTDMPSVRAVGYRQVWQLLSGELDESEAFARALAATRQLAKRQFTWLRRWPDLHWLHPEDGADLLMSQLLSHLRAAEFPCDGL